MKAIITSIGEPTTNLCKWALEKNGFEVEIIKNPESLCRKLKQIYEKYDEDFLRVDADVIVNRNLKPDFLLSLNKNVWWWQFVVFDWYKQDLGHCMSFHRQESIAPLRNNVSKFLTHLRPETELSRIEEFYHPRRFETYSDEVMGLHGFGIKDIKSVKALKIARQQMSNYDFELCERLNKLC